MKECEKSHANAQVRPHIRHDVVAGATLREEWMIYIDGAQEARIPGSVGRRRKRMVRNHQPKKVDAWCVYGVWVPRQVLLSKRCKTRVTFDSLSPKG